MSRLMSPSGVVAPSRNRFGVFGSFVIASLEERFEAMTKLPNTPKRFLEGATTPDGDIKRLMLDHANYYATTGGHGACRGCGEVTAIRLVTSMSRALLAERRQRIGSVITELEQALYLYEGGPTGNGPAPTIVANS